MLCFFASELAAVIGVNRYKSQSDAFDVVLKRMLPDVKDDDVLIGANKQILWAAPIASAAAAQMQKCADDSMEDGVALVKRARVEATVVVEQKAVEEIKVAFQHVVPEVVNNVLAVANEATNLDTMQGAITDLPEVVQQAVAPVLKRAREKKVKAVQQAKTKLHRNKLDATVCIEQKAIEQVKLAIETTIETTNAEVAEQILAVTSDATDLTAIQDKIASLPPDVQQVVVPALEHIEQEKQTALQNVEAEFEQASKEIHTVIEQTAVDEVKEAIQSTAPQVIQQVLATARDAASVETVQRTVSNLPKQIQDAVAPVVERVAQEKVQAVKQVESEIQCAFGTSREAAVRTEHARATRTAVKHNNTFLKRAVGRTFTGIPFGVGGRLDGLDAEERVVEIKNRTSRYLGLTVYEKPQLFAYMFITKTSQAVFIENLNGKSRSMHVDFDTDYWNDVASKLEAIANLVQYMKIDDEVRHEYLQLDSPGRANWIRDHLSQRNFLR